MQKINLKKTTKDKLYAMLCELETNYQSLKDETERRVEALNDELIKANVEIAGLHAELEEARKLAEKRTKDVEYLFDQFGEKNRIIDEYDAHPWRHLWKCLWR